MLQPPINKTITFLLPETGARPAGGVKIALDYANALAKSGYDVYLVYPYINMFRRCNLFLKVKQVFRPIKFFFRYSAKKWHPLERNVIEKLTITLEYKYAPKTQLYVATACSTALYLNDYPIAPERKIYFIQDYENWVMPDMQLRETYHFKMNKIVISNWLKDIVSGQEGENCIVIPNGFNPSQYYITIPIKEKERYMVSMLYNDRPQKDMETGLLALYRAHEIRPQIQAHLFGVSERPKDLPSWIIYHHNPSKEEHLLINNKCAIYLGSSRNEGWGLTVGEAMMCGQAVVCTNNLGYLEMVNPGDNALVSRIGDFEDLAKKIIELIENDSLRYKIAQRGYESISKFREEDSARIFIQLMDLHVSVSV